MAASKMDGMQDILKSPALIVGSLLVSFFNATISGEIPKFSDTHTPVVTKCSENIIIISPQVIDTTYD